jgi:hypothetical protein
MEEDANEGFLMQQALLANNRRQYQAGRTEGQPNFKIDEDMKLASAFGTTAGSLYLQPAAGTCGLD